MMTKLSQATCEREQPIGASPTSTCARATASPFRWRAGVSDVAAASLVIFFNPDPVRTLGRWVEFVRRGGRIGLTSFGRVDQAWQQADGRTVAINPPPTPILRMAYEIADLLDASTHWASSIANNTWDSSLSLSSIDRNAAPRTRGSIEWPWSDDRTSATSIASCCRGGRESST